MKKHQDDHGPYGPRLTPKEALGPDREDWLVFGQHRLLVRRPKSTDHLLDHPDIHYAFAQDEYLPYWPELWPAARMLAEFLATSGTVPPGLQTTPPAGEAPSPPSRQAIELGCGLGLPGLIALKLGYAVTFTDYDGMAMEYAVANAELNGLEGATGLFLDWRKPPTDQKFDLILGSDLLYEPGKVQPLAAIVAHLLAPGGLAVVSDPDRGPAKTFPTELFAVGLSCQSHAVKLEEANGKTLTGTIYQVHRASL